MDFSMKTIKFGAQSQLKGNKDKCSVKLRASVLHSLKQTSMVNDSEAGEPQLVNHYTDLVTRRETGKLEFPALVSRGHPLMCDQVPIQRSIPSLPGLTNAKALTARRKHSIREALPKGSFLPPFQTDGPWNFPSPPARRRAQETVRLQSNEMGEGLRPFTCDSPCSCDSLDEEYSVWDVEEDDNADTSMF